MYSRGKELQKTDVPYLAIVYKSDDPEIVFADADGNVTADKRRGATAKHIAN